MTLIYKVIILFTLVFFTGCSLTKQITGEYYLQEKKYDKGYSHFKKSISNNPNDDSSHYYYARFLLTKTQYKNALIHIKKAIELNSKNSEYYSWMGVIYSKLKQTKKEKTAYIKALELDKNNTQALTYLAHNYHDNKKYIQALKYYSKVLKIQEESQIALYNRALVLKKLKRTPEEMQAWLEYLKYYPSGGFARNAVNNLNIHNNFEYENHLIGFKTVTLKQIKFEVFSNKITNASTSSLDVLGKILEKSSKTSIHIVVYQLNNKDLAKAKAKEVKKYILKKFKKIDSKRLKLSWFDKSKKIKIQRKKYKLDESVDFITVVNK